MGVSIMAVYCYSIVMGVSIMGVYCYSIVGEVWNDVVGRGGTNVFLAFLKGNAKEKPELRCEYAARYLQWGYVVLYYKCYNINIYSYIKCCFMLRNISEICNGFISNKYLL